MFVKFHLGQFGYTVKKLKNNRSGPDWAKYFFKRHKNNLTLRMCQNIKRNRAAVSRANNLTTFFITLEKMKKTFLQAT